MPMRWNNVHDYFDFSAICVSTKEIQPETVAKYNLTSFLQLFFLTVCVSSVNCELGLIPYHKKCFKD